MSMNRPAAAYLLFSAASAGSAGWFDMRNGANYGLLAYQTPAASAILQLQASHDGNTWGNVLTVTATNTYGTAQLSGFYPFIRGVASAIYSGGGNTGYANLHYTPGIV